MKIRALCAAISMLLLTGAGLPAVPGDQTAFDKGVEAYDAGRYEEAYQIFYELAGKDDLAAMRNVALMLRRGKGVEKDPEEAEDWYERAAEAGLVTAQADLGVMLLDGEADDPDPKAAMPWLMRAAQAGHPLAQYRLGELYEKGASFMSPDVEAAKKLYGAAAAHRQKEAAARLVALLGLSEPQATKRNKAPKPAPSERAEATPVADIPAPAPPPPPRASTEPSMISRQSVPAATSTPVASPPDAATKRKTFSGTGGKPSR
jgi:TPR repeat protein